MMRYKEVVFWLGCKHPVAIASEIAVLDMEMGLNL